MIKMEIHNKKVYRWFFIITAITGILNGLYLTVLKFTNNKNLCLQGVGDCWSVNTSIYSQVFGIPVALLGTFAFVLLLGAFLLERKVGILAEYGKYILFAVSLVGVLYSIYLTYLEVAVIKAICPFCLLSAIAMLILFILAVTRLAKSQP